MLPEKQASERRSLEQALERLPLYQKKQATVLRRIERYWTRPEDARLLDVGAAQGVSTIGWQRLGFDAVGLEPWREAVETSRELARLAGADAEVVEGVAEGMPFDDASFDLVWAESVMEHVAAPDRVFREVYRVLRPGGAFYFHTSSALGFRQREIRGFPFFAWYPASLKRRIMTWAKEKRPELIGHTNYPALNWYTPWGVKRELTAVGFKRLLNRWELVQPEEYSGPSRAMLLVARRSAPGRFVGEVLKPGSGFLAIK